MRRKERLSRKLDTDAAALVLEYCERFGLDSDIKQAYTAHAMEVISGKRLAGLKPACEWADWLSATEIGETAGVSANKIGRIAKRIGLQRGMGVEGMSKCIVNRGLHSGKTVTSWLYSSAGEERILAALEQPQLALVGLDEDPGAQPVA